MAYSKKVDGNISFSKIVSIILIRYKYCFMFFLSCFFLTYTYFYQQGIVLDILYPTKKMEKRFQKDKPPNHVDKRVICKGKISNANNIKLISYTIFGNNSETKWGGFIVDIANEIRNSSLYFDWLIRIYHENLSRSFRENINSQYKHVSFCDVNSISKFEDLIEKNGMVWRYLPLVDWTVDITCFRDLDSPILRREEDAVKEWLNTGRIIHVMRDRNVHTSRIMGGLWCFKSSKNRLLAKEIWNFIFRKSEFRTKEKEAPKGNDQNVLNSYIWPLVEDDVLQHDSYNCKIYQGSVPFPTKRDSAHHYVGCVRPCNDIISKICPRDCRPEKHLDWIFC